MHVWKIWWMCVFESPFHFHPLHTAYTHVHAYTRRPKMSSVARSCSSPLIRSFDFHSCVMLFLVQSSETEECVHFISLFIMVAYAMATYTLHIPSTLQTDTYTLILHPYNNLSIQFLQAPWCVRDKFEMYHSLCTQHTFSTTISFGIQVSNFRQITFAFPYQPISFSST